MFYTDGALITDGVNVFYVTKPNSNAESSEEVIVNLPIRGNNVVKSGRGRQNACKLCGELITLIIITCINHRL